MCEMLGIPTARYDFNYSGGLHRIMNIVSIPHKKLWGERSRFNRDFETYGTVNDNYGKNLGNVIDTTTYIVTAGTSIVARQKFNNQFKLITPMYSTSAGSLSSQYPINELDSTWGWGLGSNVTNSNFKDFYVFYEYVDYFADNQLEGVIDWGNTQTTVSENISALSAWFNDDEIVDSMIDFELRKGFNMFNTNVSAASAGIL